MKRRMVVVIGLTLFGGACAAEGYEDCDVGEPLEACEAAETLYCDDYHAPFNADRCALVAEIGAESIWCCPE